MKLYFIRHGETLWNTLKIFQGTSNSPLTKKGEIQAIKLGEKLKNTDFTAFYSSPLGRTIQTSNLILKDRDIKIDYIEEFKEISLGDMEGVEREEFIRLYPTEFENFFNNPKEYNPKAYNGEDFYTLLDRVKTGLKKLVENHKKDDVVAIVSHGMTLKIIFMAINNLSFDDVSKLTVPKNTSLTIVDYTDGKYNIELFSDVSHLEGDEQCQ